MAVSPFTGVLRRVGFSVQAQLVKETVGAIRAAGQGAGAVTIAFADALQSAADSRRRLITAHKRVAEEMQSAVEGAYEETVEANKRVASYRHGQNRLPGTLRAAVTDERNFQATRDGIAYIDEAFLNEAAAHWRRMNFGSEENAESQPPGRYPVTFNGTVQFALGLQQQRGAPVLMPKGYFVEGEFYPTGSQMIRTTRGITGSNFFDAGIEALARQLPVEYAAVYKDWYDLAASQARGALARIGRGAPSPTGFF